MPSIEWDTKSSITGEVGHHRLAMNTFPALQETSFDLYSSFEGDKDERWAVSNITVEAAKSVRDALDHFITACTPVPLIKEADPELERLLAEEDEIERRMELGPRKAYDAENNFCPKWQSTPEGRMVRSKADHLRVSLAAEFLRTKVYGNSGIDGALDDADTALGFLERFGLLDFTELK